MRAEPRRAPGRQGAYPGVREWTGASASGSDAGVARRNSLLSSSARALLLFVRGLAGACWGICGRQDQRWGGDGGERWPSHDGPTSLGFLLTGGCPSNSVGVWKPR